MKTLIICLIVLGSTAMSGQEKPQIIYVFDPLCGWCYGFTPVMKKTYDTYKERVDFKVMWSLEIKLDRSAGLLNFSSGQLQE